jgi:hypothetical protein
MKTEKILALALVFLFAAYVGLVQVSPAQAQETDVIVGMWQNNRANDIHTINADQTAIDTPWGSGTWSKAVGIMFGYPYEYIWKWDFGPANPTRGNYIDYVHVESDNNHLTIVNNYHPDAAIITTATRIVINKSPIADAGDDQTANVRDIVTLDGRGSYDLDNDELTYSWTVIKQPTSMKAIGLIHQLFCQVQIQQ